MSCSHNSKFQVKIRNSKFTSMHTIIYALIYNQWRRASLFPIVFLCMWWQSTVLSLKGFAHFCSWYDTYNSWIIMHLLLYLYFYLSLLSSILALLRANIKGRLNDRYINLSTWMDSWRSSRANWWFSRTRLRICVLRTSIDYIEFRWSARPSKRSS